MPLYRLGPRPSRKAIELDPGQEPLCKTFARGPCAGPSPRALVQDPSQGPMCRTHACKPGAHVQDPCRARVYRTQAVADTAAATPMNRGLSRSFRPEDMRFRFRRIAHNLIQVRRVIRCPRRRLKKLNCRHHVSRRRLHL